MAWAWYTHHAEATHTANGNSERNLRSIAIQANIGKNNQNVTIPVTEYNATCKATIGSMLEFGYLVNSSGTSGFKLVIPYEFPVLLVRYPNGYVPLVTGGSYPFASGTVTYVLLVVNLVGSGTGRISVKAYLVSELDAVEIANVLGQRYGSDAFACQFA